MSTDSNGGTPDRIESEVGDWHVEVLDVAGRPERPDPSVDGGRGGKGWLFVGLAIIGVVGWIVAGPPEVGDDADRDRAESTQPTVPERYDSAEASVTTGTEFVGTVVEPEQPPPVVGGGLEARSSTNAGPESDPVVTSGGGRLLPDSVGARLLVVARGVATVIDLDTGDQTAFSSVAEPVMANERWVLWVRYPEGNLQRSPVDAITEPTDVDLDTLGRPTGVFEPTGDPDRVVVPIFGRSPAMYVADIVSGETTEIDVETWAWSNGLAESGDGRIYRYNIDGDSDGGENDAGGAWTLVVEGLDLVTAADDRVLTRHCDDGAGGSDESEADSMVDCDLLFLDRANGAPIEGPEPPDGTLRFLPGSNRVMMVATDDLGTEVHLWDAETDNNLGRIGDLGALFVDASRRAAVTPDDRYLIREADGVIEAMELDTGLRHPLLRLPLPSPNDPPARSPFDLVVIPDPAPSSE